MGVNAEGNPCPALVPCHALPRPCRTTRHLAVPPVGHTIRLRVSQCHLCLGTTAGVVDGSFLQHPNCNPSPDHNQDTA